MPVHAGSGDLERNQKSYSLPSQFLPYSGLGDDQIRQLVNKVREKEGCYWWEICR